MNILAVDDKKLPLDALMEAIRTVEPDAALFGYRSSREALEFARKHVCDVAFIDIEMPELSGIDLAKLLKQTNPAINVVFATGYNQYAAAAMEMHASGYLMKPITPEKVRRELDDLRHPVPPAPNVRVRFQTFGSFEVFIDERAVEFHYNKTKEYLAYLVDRGSMCTNSEIAAALWEKNISDSYIRVLRKDLVDTFKSHGVEDVILLQRNRQGIWADKVSCDLYDWRKGLPHAINAYRGEYMIQYSWAEFRHVEMIS